MVRICEEFGQALFRPPSVKGWDGGPSWIQASSWIARHNRLSALAQAHLEDGGEPRVDLGTAFGSIKSKQEVPSAVTAVLLPDGTDRDYDETLLRAARGAEGIDHALATVAALVLTSLEYHLV